MRPTARLQPKETFPENPRRRFRRQISLRNRRKRGQEELSFRQARKFRRENSLKSQIGLIFVPLRKVRDVTTRRKRAASSKQRGFEDFKTSAQNRRHPSRQRRRLPRRPPRRLPTTVPSPRGLEDFETSAKIVGILHTEKEGRLPGTASITTTSTSDEKTSEPGSDSAKQR